MRQGQRNALSILVGSQLIRRPSRLRAWSIDGLYLNVDLATYRHLKTNYEAHVVHRFDRAITQPLHVPVLAKLLSNGRDRRIIRHSIDRFTKA
ncbi:hypothetical protein D3C84_1021490 [compost metagenome]